jgi:hypothetical protein
VGEARSSELLGTGGSDVDGESMHRAIDPPRKKWIEKNTNRRIEMEIVETQMLETP